jgi:Mlc titration factor MtfA (ptsG expression regulator)
MRFETRHHRQRRERLEAGFDPAWAELLATRNRTWSQLGPDERERLGQLTVLLLAELHWEAANGFELTEDIEVTIAADAAVLLLGLPDDSFRKVHTVLVHPTTVVLAGEHSQVPGVVSDDPMPILGQADLHGPVLIVWDAVLAEARHPGSGHNVVFHEFAHRLDMLTGEADGTPPLGDPELSARWVQVCTEVYDQVARGAGSPVLRSYAGVNPAEFFAVATEAFFDAPTQLRHVHPELYGVLGEFYRQDPATRWR